MSRTRRRSPSVTGELSPNVWYFSQLGLVEVAYQLRRINHHLKVFAAIRKEAYARCRSAPRWSSSTAAARSTSSTRRRACARSSSTTSASSKPTEWCCPSALRSQSARGVPRPPERDRRLHARGGGRLRVRLPPHAAAAARPDDDRRAAGRAAPRRAPQRAPPQGGGEPGGDRDRARVPGRDRALRRRARSRSCLFDRLPGHVHEPRRGRADRRASDDDATTARTGCSALYRVGLLGYVQHDRVRGEWRQRFLRPGEATLETERRAAAGDALPGPPGAVRRDRRATTPPSCSASTASTSSATTGRGASRARSSARSTCASAAC